MKGILAIGGLLLLGVALVFVLYVSTNAKEQRLRITGTNQQKNAEQILANGKNMVKGVASVNKSYEGAFMEIVEKTIQGRQGGGTLAKALTEANINLPPETYLRVMTVIEEFRKKYENEQTKLLAIKTEHDAIVIHPFWSLFITNKAPLEVTIVTSTGAREAYETGVDDDTDPYSNKK